MAKTKYVAEDGTQFDTYWECQVYETKPTNGGIQMFDNTGMTTPDVVTARLIYIPNVMDEDGEYVLAAKWFIDQCIEQGISYADITDLSHGCFYLVDSYVEIDKDLIKLLNAVHLSV